MSLQNKQIAFIGGGNMAEAFVRGLLKAGAAKSAQIIVTDIRPERLEYFAKAFGVATLTDNTEAGMQADIIVLAVKPQQMKTVLGHVFPAGKLFISIAAGIPTQQIESALSGQPRVIRVMPNTPALVGAGAAGICPGTYATEADLQAAELLLRSVGICVRVEESQMNAVTALSGSGPAYLFYFTETLIQAGRDAGLDPELARQLAVQTVLGAAKLMGSTDESPAELRRKVTSPGGTTEAALKVLSAQLPAIMTAAVQAAAKRGQELATA